jgi:hypothetical protein
MEINRELSHEIARKTKATTWKTWANAVKAINYLEGQPVAYIEGWIVLDEKNGSLVVEHGWLELNGEIIDPTLWGLNCTYFPGVRIDPPPKELPALKSFGSLSKEYYKNYPAAYQKALALSKKQEGNK